MKGFCVINVFFTLKYLKFLRNIAEIYINANGTLNVAGKTEFDELIQGFKNDLNASQEILRKASPSNLTFELNLNFSGKLLKLSVFIYFIF